MIFIDFFLSFFQMIQKEMRAKAEDTQESSSEFEDNDEIGDREDLVSEGSGDNNSSGDQDGGEESFDRQTSSSKVDIVG
jgi:hypothetical protein